MEIEELLQYGYKPGQEVLVPADFLLGLINFCERVELSQPQLGAILSYPKSVREIKNDKGEIVKVDIDWAEHSPNSFFNTAFDEKGAIPIVTDLAMYALQTKNALFEMHKKNIENKVAIKTIKPNGDA